MFKLLHRILVVAYWACWAVFLFYLYTQRERAQPALDYAEILWHRDSSGPRPLPVVTGIVTRVYAGDGFSFRDGEGVDHNFGLAGTTAPRTNLLSTAEDRALAASAYTYLSQLLTDRPVVRIEVTLAIPQNRTGLGLTWLGGVNLNEQVLAHGLGTLRRDQIRALPVQTQYRLARAERIARRQNLGVWAPRETPSPPLPADNRRP